jgi:hypothetical protein
MASTMLHRHTKEPINSLFPPQNKATTTSRDSIGFEAKTKPNVWLNLGLDPNKIPPSNSHVFQTHLANQLWIWIDVIMEQAPLDFDCLP